MERWKRFLAPAIFFTTFFVAPQLMSTNTDCETLITMKGYITTCLDEDGNLIIWHRDHEPITLPKPDPSLTQYPFILSDSKVIIYTCDNEVYPWLIQEILNPQTNEIVTREVLSYN